MTEKTLLQKAKETSVRSPKNKYTKEHIELAIAWANDEITVTQCQAALNSKNGSSVYHSLLYILKQHVRQQNKKP